MWALCRTPSKKDKVIKGMSSTPKETRLDMPAFWKTFLPNPQSRRKIRKVASKPKRTSNSLPPWRHL